MLKKCVAFMSLIGAVSALSYGCSSTPTDTTEEDTTPATPKTEKKPTTPKADDEDNSSSSTSSSSSSSSSSGGPAEVAPACVPTDKASWDADTNGQALALVKEPTARTLGACSAAEISSMTTGVMTLGDVMDKAMATSANCQACLIGTDPAADKLPLFVFDGAPSKDTGYDNLTALTDYGCVWHEAGDKCGTFEGMANLCLNVTCNACVETTEDYQACSAATFGKATSMYSTCTAAATTYNWQDGCTSSKLSSAERKCGNVLKQIGFWCGGSAVATDAGGPH